MKPPFHLCSGTLGTLVLGLLIAATSLAPQSTAADVFFIEAEDFDFDGGHHQPEADLMPYPGGAYAGLSARAEIDYHDPNANENAEYRPPSQGVAMYPSGDLYREGSSVLATYRVAWNHPGDWFNYTRNFPLRVRDYNLYLRMSSGSLSNAVRLDEVVSGAGTTNQALTWIGEARGPASGGWESFLYVPFRDAGGQLARLSLAGSRTLRLTILEGGSEDINYLELIPADALPTGNCLAGSADAVAWWPGDGNSLSLAGTNHGQLRNGAGFTTGLVAGAFNFDGTDDYVETSLDVQPGALPESTWEAWVFPTRSGGRQQILSCDDGGYDRSVLVEGTSFGIFTGWGVWTPTTVSFSQWQHIAVVFGRTNVEFYKNGERFSYGVAPTGQGTGNRLQIGRNPGFGEYFRGSIDEISIYSRAFTGTEIQSIYAAGARGKCKSDTNNPVTPHPKLFLTPSNLNFGPVRIGQSSNLTLTVRNTGDAPLLLTSASSSNPRFTLAAPTPPFTLATNAGTNLTVRFAPTSSLIETGTLTLVGDDPNQPSASVDLAGKGLPSELTPALLSLQPSNGPPGSVVFVTGTGFSFVKSENHVEFNGTSGSVLSARPSELVVVIPEALPPGQATVVVSVNGKSSNPGSYTVTSGMPVSLAIRQTGNNAVLSWPVEAARFQLESTAVLSPASPWSKVSSPPVLLGGRNQITINPTDTARYFRLRTVDGNEPVPAAVSSGRGRVLAASGGTITTADQSAAIVIPAGALTQDTEIEITSVTLPAGDGRPPGGDILLSPDGLTFSHPATLRILTPGASPEGHHLSVQLLSGEHPAREVGGEISYFQKVTNFTFNATSGQLELPLGHFSAGIWNWAKNLYAVLEIPGRYLHKGDLLYVLTGAFNSQGGDWLPGHCGLYLGTQSGFSGANDGLTLIEATQTHALVLGEVRFDKYSKEQKGFLNLAGTHIFMGARRPSRFDLTDNQRTDVTEWAVSKLGQPYLVVGGGAFLSSDVSPVDGYTCVGFTELAYEFGAGKAIVPSQTARILFTPFRQFQWTDPINYAEIKVGEDFDCQVSGVVNMGTAISNDYYTDIKYYTREFDLDYCDQDARNVIEAKRAKFEPTFGVFTFTPIAADGGKDFKFAFRIDASSFGAGIERTEMIIQVEGPAVVGLVRQVPALDTHTLEGVFNFENIKGVQTATANSVTITNRQAIMKLSWPSPPESLPPDGKFDFSVKAEVTELSTYPLNWVVSVQPIVHYYDETGKFFGVVNGNTSQSGYNSLRKPFTLSTNTPVSAFLPTVPLGSGGKNFTIASFEVHIFKVVSGGIFQEELYHVFWDYHRVP